MTSRLEVKAILLSEGSVSLDLPFAEDGKASSGPSAGADSLFLNLGNDRVHLKVSGGAKLRGVLNDDILTIFRGGKELVTGTIELPSVHCPNQAYITLSGSCIFNCLFCAVPRLGGGSKTIAEVLELVEKVRNEGRLEAISLTSGVADSPEKEVSRAVRVLESLKGYGVPIGVSFYPTGTSTAEFRDAGASEIKYNIETMDRKVFQRVCLGKSYDFLLESLKEAVPQFGENRVFSNFLVGLGESDDTVEEGVKTLCEMGVIPIVRPVKPNPLQGSDLYLEQVSASRLMKLRRILKDEVEEFGLNPESAKTMCLPCRGCDLR